MNISKLSFLYFLILLGISPLYSQNAHVEKVALVPMGITGNDCWGYIDSSGTEYAIMGLQDKAIIYSLEDPSHPRLIGKFPGSSSTWRDIKSWKNYIYVVTEAQDGILIINMKDTTNITSSFFTPEIPVNGQKIPLKSAHNIYIDENGFAYLAGTKVSKGGVVILDLRTDPEHPTFAGIEDAAYAHDVVTQRDTMYTSDIYNGELSIWDVHDKANPMLLGKTNTTSNFTHNAWPSTDGRYVFTTDERSEGRLDAYDITDLNNIKRLDTYKAMDGMNRGVIPHNTHYKDGFLITSWYTDGVKIIDAHKPDNLIEVGSYKTHKGRDGGFGGCWGTFPFYPSGLVIASDRGEGLYILRPEYQRACYLEGMITDKNDGTPIQSATVQIETPQYNYEMSNIEGQYKSGLADSGLFTVTFRHPDYLPVTKTDVRLDHGQVTILDVEMVKKEQISFSGRVVDAVSNTPIGDAWVQVATEDRMEMVRTNAMGEFALNIIASGGASFDIAGGKWGYMHQVMKDVDPSQRVTIPLSLGYQDDFLADQKWVVQTNAKTGGWERGIPLPVAVGGPTQDVTGDIGRSCYITGNHGTQIGEDDIDDGTTVLTSPSMDLSKMHAPVISLQYWFNNFGGGGTPPNDSLLIYLVQGNQPVQILSQTTPAESWVPYRVVVKDILQGDLSDIKVKIVCGDYDPGHVVEAGIDAFFVTDSIGTASRTPLSSATVLLHPNPVRNRLYFQNLPSTSENFHLVISDISSKVLYEMVKSREDLLTKGISVGTLSSGTYFLQITSNQRQTFSRKFIKQ